MMLGSDVGVREYVWVFRDVLGVLGKGSVIKIYHGVICCIFPKISTFQNVSPLVDFCLGTCCEVEALVTSVCRFFSSALNISQSFKTSTEAPRRQILQILPTPSSWQTGNRMVQNQILRGCYLSCSEGG